MLFYSERENIQYKNKLKSDFKSFCKENKDDDISKREYAEEIWIDYRDRKIAAYNKYHEDYADIKMDSNNDRNKWGVEKGLPTFQLKNYNLHLRNDLSKNTIIYLSIFTIISALIWIAAAISISIFTPIVDVFMLVLIGLIVLVDLYVFHKETSKYWYIEDGDSDVINLQDKLDGTVRSFKRICNSPYHRFKNGNIRWGRFEESINDWYKNRIISFIDNPYEVSSKKVLVNSNNFITSGGVYAWWYNEYVVYIGKTNNFKRRMKEHTEGLMGIGDHSEYKYSIGVHPSEVHIQILAITNDEDEQSVLESFYFDKYNSKNLLNSTGTLSWKKIMTRQKYRDDETEIISLNS